MTAASRVLLRGFPGPTCQAQQGVRMVGARGASNNPVARVMMNAPRAVIDGTSTPNANGGANRRLCAGGPAAQPAEPSVEVPIVNFELPPADIGSALKPREVVDLLERHIVGQPEAKRAMAIALRNRWRRTKLSPEVRSEVIPKNILMIGPTGCGKTEIARRIAKLSQSPFIKVEATKFTEVGFHGKDVDQIIKDLVEISVTMTKKQQVEKLRQAAAAKAEEDLLDLLVGSQNSSPHQRETFRNLLRSGHLDGTNVKVDVPVSKGQGANMVLMPEQNQLPQLFAHVSKMATKRIEEQELPVRAARPLMEDIEIEKKLDMATITRDAIKAVEESGIVFIDEIDKICSSGDKWRGADASAEGVQRDMLPMIEGSVISTKHGNVNTDFILFIASGAFHTCKPSDLLAELQGRLPIRVQLKGLSETEMYRILTEPVNNLIQQQMDLLKTEDVEIKFTDPAIREIARIASEANKTVENIGARRLHTVLERIVEVISFDAADKEPGTVVTVDLDLVKDRVGDLLAKSDFSKYII